MFLKYGNLRISGLLRACLVCVEVVSFFYFYFLYSFSILKSCTNFLFPSFFFLFGIIFYFVFLFIFFFFYDNHQQRERERERSVIMGPTDLIFLWKCHCIHFQENETRKKVIFIFCIQILFFFNTKNENWIQIQSQTSFLMVGFTKTENKYKIHNFFAQTKQTLRLPWE